MSLLLIDDRAEAGGTAFPPLSDDEAAFLYDIQQPNIDVPPGAEVRVPVKVRPPERKTFGQREVRPFQIVATGPGMPAKKLTVDGQLAIAPPIGSWKKPAGVLLVLAAAGAILLRVGIKGFRSRVLS